jgi:hypothetical protein
MNPLSLEKRLLVADICHIDSGARPGGSGSLASRPAAYVVRG